MLDSNKIDRKASGDRAGFTMQKHWHNRFHLEMPAGVLQNPDGVVFFEGEYHIFCPWSPDGDAQLPERWFHIHTRDFVRCSRPEEVFWPEGMAGSTAAFLDAQLLAANFYLIVNNFAQEGFATDDTPESIFLVLTHKINL